MEIVAIKSFQCVNCGASININKIKRNALCEYCDTNFGLQLCEKAELEFNIAKGNATLGLMNYDAARNFYEQAIAINPLDWRSWFGIVQCYTKNFSYYEKEHLVALAETRRLVDSDAKIKIEDKYAEYARQLKLHNLREQHIHVMKYYSAKGTVYSKIVNSVIPTCPFCKSVSHWHERKGSTDFFKCPSCLAEIKVKLTFFTNKVKTVDIIDVGIVDNEFSVGSIDPKLIVPSSINIK